MTNSESNHLLRQRATMVIFSLEQSLGDFIKQRHSASPAADHNATIATVLARSDPTGIQGRRQRVSKAIADSYLDELLRIAVALANGTDSETPLAKLRDLVHAISLLEVRNAVAHPNRDFPDNFWFRCAVVATSSPVAQLGLMEVSHAFQAALADKITLPPEDWYELDSSLIPSNLPIESDHDITGLVGRNKEKNELLKVIRQRRSPFIVITGPGGLGKTALAIQTLREYSQDYSEEPEHEFVLFCSLKQERLTANGVETLTAAQSMEELSEELFNNIVDIIPEITSTCFDDACKELSSRVALLFIDNLETLLRDSPDAFVQFVDALPRQWTVLGTSRVSVDGSKAIPLPQLSKNDAASLAFRYADTKGVEIDTRAATTIADSSQCNPLALRLAIDQIANGSTLSAATHQASKDVVQFSFQNLIETLNNTSRNVLECLFVKSPLVRGEIVTTLELTPDEAVDAARGLARTSLVTRTIRHDDELFELNPSIRDLLRDSPLDLTIRRKISRTLERQRRELQLHRTILQDQSVSLYSEDYLPADIPPALGAALTKVIRFLKSKESSYQKSSDLLKFLTSFKYSHPNNWRLLIQLGKLSSYIQDDFSAEENYKQAVTCDPNSVTPRLILASFYVRIHRSDAALENTSELLLQGYGDPEKTDEHTSSQIWFAHFRAAIEQGKYDLVSGDQISKYSNERLINCYRVFKAEATIRKISGLHGSEPEKCLSQLAEATNRLVLVSQGSYYSRSLSKTVVLLCRELRHLVDIAKTSNTDQHLLLISNNFEKILQHRNLDQEAEDAIASVARYLAATDSKNGAFSSSFWLKILGITSKDPELEKRLLSEGYRFAFIFKVPNGLNDGLPAFCFARGDKGDEYFIHKDNLERSDLVEWARIRIGRKVALTDISPAVERRKLPIPQKVLLI